MNYTSKSIFLLISFVVIFILSMFLPMIFGKNFIDKIRKKSPVFISTPIGFMWDIGGNYSYYSSVSSCFLFIAFMAFPYLLVGTVATVGTAATIDTGKFVYDKASSAMS